MLRIVIICIAVSMFLSGCSEKPERKAAKDVRKTTDKAEDIISKGRSEARKLLKDSDTGSNINQAVAKANSNFEQAQALIAESFKEACEELEKSVKKNGRASKDAKASALLTNANLAFERALYLQTNLPKTESMINRMLQSLNEATTKTVDLATAKKSLENKIESNNIDIQILQNTIEYGTDAFDALSIQLKDKTKQLNALMIEKQDIEAQAKEAQDTANTIEKLAVDKLREAETLSGEEKTEAQNKGYELRFSKKQYSAKLQSCLDKLDVIESKIAIVKPIKEKIISDIDALNQKITELKSSNGNEKLAAQVREIQASLNIFTDKINSVKSELNSTMDKYKSSIAEIEALMKDAISKYESVNSSTAKLTTKSRIAASNLWMAATYAQGTKFAQSVQSRLKSIGEINGLYGGSYSQMLDSAKAKVSQYGKLSMELYDKAIKEYADAGSDCSVIKSHVMAFYGKISLSSFLSDMGESLSNLADTQETSEAALKLIEKAKECDPDFVRSVTARMFAGEADYAPKLKVDQAEYYEELKRQFLGWRKLRGEAKEAEVNRLLALLEEMGTPEDPEAFEKILGPERKALEDALKKGFDDEEEEAVDFFGSFNTDPNN